MINSTPRSALMSPFIYFNYLGREISLFCIAFFFSYSARARRIGPARRIGTILYVIAESPLSERSACARGHGPVLLRRLAAGRFNGIQPGAGPRPARPGQVTSGYARRLYRHLSAAIRMPTVPAVRGHPRLGPIGSAGRAAFFPAFGLRPVGPFGGP